MQGRIRRCLPAAPAPTIRTFFFLGALDEAPFGLDIVGSKGSDEVVLRIRRQLRLWRLSDNVEEDGAQRGEHSYDWMVALVKTSTNVYFGVMTCRMRAFNFGCGAARRGPRSGQSRVRAPTSFPRQRPKREISTN
jgi:hypothetical protein